MSGVASVEKSEHHDKLSGVTFVLMYVTVASTGSVYTGGLLEDVDPNVLLFLAFLITTLFFLSATLLGREQSTTRISHHIRDVSLLNLFTVTSWVGFFYALENLEPAIVNALFIGIGPIVSLISNAVLRRHAKVHPVDIVACLGVLIASGFLMWTALSGNSSLQGRSTQEIGLGLFFALLGGVTIPLAVIYSKKLHEAGFVTNQIMAHRFYFLIFLLIFLMESRQVFPVAVNYPMEVLLVTFLSVLLPLYFLQLGIKKIEPVLVQIIIASSPVVIFLCQLFDERLVASVYSLVGVAILALFAGVAIVSNIRRKF